ncbi:MAG: hypothetical protein MI864_20405, partial [Pseudomonadales bacterium]|nr:hypothetical protein [Pseudomonadales bacterium]
MLPQLVHTIGATTYFVIFILMVWVNQIPKTDQGPLFWAMAMCFAFLARLVILIPLLSDIAISFSFYCIFITFEKLALLLGAIRCFKVESDTRWWWALALCSIVWLILAEALSISNWVYAIGLEIYNITTLLFLSYFTYLYRDKVNNAFILAISVTSFLLAVHWSTFVLSYFNATWKTNGFMIGTALMLTQYLALLGAQLSLIQQRL